METINTKTKILFFLFTISVFSCKAQQLPLNTSLKNIPMNAYVKDLNNELYQYTGAYKTNFQGKEIILHITKEENKLMDYGDQKFYRDALVIKYIVKNSSGTVLQDTKNNATSKIDFFSIGTKPDQNKITFSYSGTNCNVGWGKIILKKINDTQISWEYRPNDIILDDSKCPPGTDINIYLPETKDLIFTKQ
ncbi:DUF6705 family protein [Chryseobacterium gallinarum]|uniref:DUF6705 domain-containing protein n=1 Tax=Chryseobacterium gallinarum TaxID=1324352 RepID=A0A0G3LYX4_CHRGL|nr:DUF6705 family protein [Chryseobacterium gallinarum]AKK72126.1 hypothetical protein OK18_05285 [Chryseobacterium gallinarum]MCL8535689.1 hypothetical protein [Chryseobacterium gallinarum]QIY92169.1 hypothetical protein FOB44_16550 [Chryseobacterium gallinarum]